MIPATAADKDLVVSILTQAFAHNNSVQYIIPPRKRGSKSVAALMSYSFEQCLAFGQVWLSPDKNACALVLHPNRKRTNFHSVLLDVQLVWNCTGVSHVGKALQREAKIKKLHPKEPIMYLWFIGVLPQAQGHGHGTQLLQEIVAESLRSGLPLYLETSVPRNVSWYQRMGFKLYHQLDFGYPLYCLRRLL